MLLKRNSLVVLCVWLAVVQGCRHQSASTRNLTVSYDISPQPARVGDVTITMRMTDGSNEPVAGARIKLEGHMSHAGMTPVLAEAKEIGPGHYRADVSLSMAGDWQFLVHLTLPDGRQLDQQLEIKAVAPA